MQDELLTNMRESAKDKQQIFALNEQVKALQTRERVQIDDAEADNARSASLQDAVNLLRVQLDERASALEVSISECALRTVEVERQRVQIVELKRENGEILTRLITMKEAEAEKYNEIHRLMDEAEKKKRAADVYKPGAGAKEPSSTAVGMSDVLKGTEGGFGLSFKSSVPSRPKHTIVAHERSEVHSLAHNSSGSMLLTGSDDRTVKLWDSRSGTKLSSLEGAVKAVMCVAFSNDGARLFPKLAALKRALPSHVPTSGPLPLGASRACPSLLTALASPVQGTPCSGQAETLRCGFGASRLAGFFTRSRDTRVRSTPRASCRTPKGPTRLGTIDT